MAKIQLGELADVRMGYPFRSRLEHCPGGDVVVVQMKDIDDASLLDLKDPVRVVLPQGKSRHLLRAGDLLFRSRGRTNDAALVPAGVGPAVLAAPMLLIKPHDVLPAYLCWFINATPTQEQISALAEGTSVQMISAQALKSLEVPLPSLDTQQTIAEAAALAKREQALRARIADLRQGLTSHLLMKNAHEANR